MKTQQSPDIQIGETVSVMCVAGERYSHKTRHYTMLECMPVLPYEPHEDGEILDFPYPHYHFDWRFWSDKLIESFFDDGRRYNLDETIFFKDGSILKSPQDWPATIQRSDCTFAEPYYREMVCVRELPMLAHHYTFLQALEAAHLGQSLSKDHICPHRGFLTFPASSEESKKTGCSRVCPGHGLGWDKQGKLCRRYAR